jgi:outer membrane protein, multidrug efflux system
LNNMPYIKPMYFFKVLGLATIFFVYSCKPIEKTSVNDIAFQPINSIVSAEKINDWNRGVSEYFEDDVLYSLVNEALENNLSLKQSKESIGKSRADLIQAKGLSKPFIQAVAGSGLQRYGFYTQEGIGNWDANFSPNLNEDMFMGRNLPDYKFGFQASWEIDIWGKIRNQRESAMYDFLAMQESYEWLRMQIATRTITEYITLLSLLKKKQILTASIEIQDLALSYAIKQKEIGGSNQLAVSQFKARLNNIKVLVAQLELQIQQQYNSINFILGRFTGDIPIKLEILSNSFNLSFDKSPTELFENRPDIRQAMLNLEKSGANIEVARKAFYPTLGLNGLFGLQTFNHNFFLDPSSTTFSIFGNLLSPLLNRSAQNASLTFAKSSHEQNFFALQEKVLEAYFDVVNQTLAIDNLVDQLKLKSEEALIISKSTEDAIQLFKSGRVGYLDVLSIQNNALNSQMEVVDNQLDLFIARVNLFRALGGF